MKKKISFSTQGTGIARVDIFKMDADDKAFERWDALQIVGNAKNSEPGLRRISSTAIKTGCLTNCNKWRLYTG